MSTIKNILHKLKFRAKIVCYNIKKPRIKNIIQKKNSIRVVFFVLYDNMWKSDGLFRLLMASERFDPYIVSSPYPHHPREFSRNNQSKLEKFFHDKGFPYINGYDFDLEQWFDIKSFHPDIVFYQQPYNTGYKGFKIEQLWKKCLFAYIPYTYELEDNPVLVNSLLMNIAWKVFLPSEYEVKRQSTILLNSGDNLIATGAPLADALLQPQVNVNNIWKQNDTKIKKVIWAPHHSILSEDLLHYSNFLEVSERMLDIAEKYQGKIQFAFKPHPVLKRKLYKLHGWGKSTTDSYYMKWASMPNTTIVEGEYVDLFKSSDAMIHDCSTFTAEYLFTRKPVMFLEKQGQAPSFNEFGKACYSKHYIGNTPDDVEMFLRDIVLSGNDSMKAERDEFFVNTLMPSDNKDTAHRIFDIFNTDFNI